MVQSIEQYDDVLKVILKPTKVHPTGSYFYTDASARELVEAYTWYLDNTERDVHYILARSHKTFLKFHKAYAESMELYIDCIDHQNGVGIDNRDANLFVADASSNIINKPSRGYSITRGRFQVNIKLDGITHYCGSFNNEFDAIKAAHTSRQKYFGEYCYNFLLDRRGDLDILDDEITGKITSEEATFHHVMRYAKDNAWYVYRYGLEEYFKSRGIQIPAFEIDYKGYMIDTITKERLCPFK